MIRHAVAVTLLTALLAVGTADAKPKRWYWTETKAEQAVFRKVLVPYCQLVGEDCATERVKLRVGSADCRGASELRDTFRFARFMCRFEVRYGYGEGRVAIWARGPQYQARWKIVELYRT